MMLIGYNDAIMLKILSTWLKFAVKVVLTNASFYHSVFNFRGLIYGVWWWVLETKDKVSQVTALFGCANLLILQVLTRTFVY